MATLDQVYCKFGEAAEAAQLLETQLGNILFALNAIGADLLEAKDSQRATEILDGVNRATLGQLLRRLQPDGFIPDALENQLAHAVAERNRLFHAFYRQHNFHRNSEAGCELMLNDLEVIHATLINALKAVHLLTGVDLEALARSTPDSGSDEAPVKLPIKHLPI